MKQNRFLKRVMFGLAVGLLCVLSGRLAMTASAKAKLQMAGWYVGVNEKCQIYLDGKVKKASYSFVSQNKKVARVTSKGVATGLTIGKAKIKVTQKLNGKKTVVGTFTLKVQKATFYSDLDLPITISSQTGLYEKKPRTVHFKEYIGFRNKKAKYTAVSTNTKKLKLAKKGKDAFLIKGANGTGSVGITFKETYKGKTRTIGTLKFKLCSPKYYGEENAKISIGETFSPYANFVEKSRIVYSSENKAPDPNNWSAEQSGVNCITCSVSKDALTNIDFKGVAVGTAYVWLYAYNYNTGKWETKSFAHFTITVYEVTTVKKVTAKFCEEGDMEEEQAWKGDSISNPTEFISGSTKVLSLYQKPYNYTGDITVVSSDPNVVKVEEFKKAGSVDDVNGFIGRVFLTPLSIGTATIKIEANGYSEEHYVVVKEDVLTSESEDVTRVVMLNEQIPYNYDYYDEFESNFVLKTSNDCFNDTEGCRVYTDSDDKYVRAVEFDVSPNFDFIENETSVQFSVYYNGREVGVYTTTVKPDSNNSDGDDYYEDDDDDSYSDDDDDYDYYDDDDYYNDDEDW